MFIRMVRVFCVPFQEFRIRIKIINRTAARFQRSGSEACEQIEVGIVVLDFHAVISRASCDGDVMGWRGFSRPAAAIRQLICQLPDFAADIEFG